MSARRRAAASRFEDDDVRMGAYNGSNGGSNGYWNELNLGITLCTSFLVVGLVIIGIITIIWVKDVRDGDHLSVSGSCPVECDACQVGVFNDHTSSCSVETRKDGYSCSNTAVPDGGECDGGVCKGDSCLGACGTNVTICTDLAMEFDQPANTTACHTSLGCTWQFENIAFVTASATNCGTAAQTATCVGLLGVNETRTEGVAASVSCGTDELTCTLYFACAA